MAKSTPAFQDLTGSAERFDPHRAEHEIHRAVNQVRTAHGLESLSYQDDIANVARQHSHDMAAQGYVGHQSPGGANIKDRLDKHTAPRGSSRTQYTACGENIARSHYDSRVALDDGTVIKFQSLWEFGHGVVHGWMQSSGHRSNILRDSWTAEGIGIVKHAQSEVLVTQVFIGSHR
ncbi:hypothetical protein B9H04_06895 [Halorubrum ezzemoulense DSM 17463]|uniref:SCP domain-containing protein n=1 Tax=Halorubrum ezzemoulense DSM 17463 TaxID=1121945 RepID=A0A1X4H8N2_HALEZ|nr:hypothetical protein B9H04_06895 [Halorubrum ezzemoulense DSM 17463]